MNWVLVSEETPPVERHEVEVWQFALDPLAATMSDLTTCLSEDERERAARFCFEVHRRRWVTARIALRQVLALHAGASPASLRFYCDAYGKPALLPPHDGVHFNLTHSGDLGLLAIAPAPIGIDVECVDPRLDWDALTRRVASDDEREALCRSPGSEQRAAFFRLWTRKEAYIKGRGLGLSLPLSAITVPVTALPGPGDIRVEAIWDDGQPWRLWDLEVPESHMASLCYAETLYRLRRHLWSPADQPATT